MIKSMTGFGSGESQNKDYKFKIEIKTVNHRYNNINIKLPYHINHLEDHIKKSIEKKIKRGTVDVYVYLEYLDESAIDVSVDLPLAKAYKKALEDINEQLGLDDEIRISHILNMREVIKTDKKEIDDDSVLEPLNDAISKALSGLLEMRELEGEQLSKDMILKLDLINSYLLNIENRSPIIITEYKDRLKKNISEILSEGIPIDEDRLNNEVAYFVDKSGIDEEIVRLKTHIKQFKNIINNEDIVGRKLDFLIQEINREINTIGSKSQDSIISENVVNMKAELEKIREQVQNIE